MENRPNLKPYLILGGALLGAFLALTLPAFAYDQKNTHPALTDEIVDFYNTSFPNEKLTEEEKRWLIKGSIDEDIGERPLFHFYDPVYNRGIFANLTSKDWALKNKAQANYYNKQLAGFPSLLLEDSNSDFSYTRALDDYTRDDKKRAFVIFGHVLHLLEDAGVPDHTRNDPHPPVLNLGSPYEHEMAKWGPQNFKIVSKLTTQREKPVILSSIEGYFDRIANYSNNNFFSKNTIFSFEYDNPAVDFWEYQSWPIEKFTGYKKDKFGKFPLVEKNVGSSFYTINNVTILDGYWERLSREVVINGAGALNLFLEEAERARQDYLVKAGQKKPSFWAQIASLFGIGDEQDGELATSDGQRTSDVNDGKELTTSDVQKTSDVKRKDAINNINVVTGAPTDGDKRVTPVLSPSVSPILSSESLVSPVSTSSPQASVSPKVLPSLSPTPKLTTSDGQKTSDVKTGRVVINEIAWAGTEASAADEWVELYNAENSPIDLLSWRLFSDDESPNIIFQERTIIPANGYFLIERTNDETIKDLPADLAISFGQGGLGNEGEVLKLTDSFGTVADTVGRTGEGWFAGNAEGKYSMERISATVIGGDPSNWKNFSGAQLNRDANGNFINGTPKTANSIIVVITGVGGVYNNPSVSPSSSPEPSGDIIGPVVINEIGWMGTATSSNDEWIELYNNTSASVDMTGWMLTAQDGTPSITLSGTISGFGFYLLERTDDSVISDIFANQIYTGALGNSGENLKLHDGSGNTKDSADFTTGWPAGDNTTKSSMERINPKTSGNNSTNWNTNNSIIKNSKDAAGNPINGTPKAKNSSYID